ncbi:MAG TPA: primosome assembly protein PriA, partial [Pseudonocardiaceae bacterium]|nr:primosome assembly protein PriA [Pseudonocardiaceae bacterium]
MASGDTTRHATRRGVPVAAAVLPVARVCVDVPLAHLDRPFDYQVPDRFADTAMPGVRVRVRFAGQLVDGFVLERVGESGHKGKLAFLEKVVSPEPVLSPDIARLARAVADRYGGMLIDVLRLAIPPRHAQAEKAEKADESGKAAPPDVTAWGRYPRGAAYLDAVGQGRPARAVWHAVPMEDWPARLAEAAACAAGSGRGAILVVPDHRDSARVYAACARLLGDDGVVSLAADLGPAERYRRWLAVRRGTVR